MHLSTTWRRKQGIGEEGGEADLEGAGTSGRFTEGDLLSVAHLVGLQTITSTQEHAGSRSLFLFEQLTRLDRFILCLVGSYKTSKLFSVLGAISYLAGL